MPASWKFKAHSTTVRYHVIGTHSILKVCAGLFLWFRGSSYRRSEHFIVEPPGFLRLLAQTEAMGNSKCCFMHFWCGRARGGGDFSGIILQQ